ncbi:MAG: hypothetical protein R6V19_15425 [Armatimonadota bacterium]
MSRNAKGHVLALTFLLVYCIILFLALIFGGMPYQDDTGRETAPQMEYYARWLKQGHIPVWNHEVGSGYYQHASGQSAMYYPPNLLLYRIFHWTVALRLSLFLHVFAACVWVYFIGILLKLRSRTALLLGLCVGGGGVMAAHQLHLNIVLGLSNGFLVALAAIWWMQKDSGLMACLAGIAAVGLALLGGQPMYVWLSALLIAALYVAASKSEEVKVETPLRMLGKSILVAGGGILLAGVQTIPLLQYSRTFPRPEPAGHYAFITAGSFQWSDFWHFLVPATNLKPVEGMNYWETLGYIGILPVVIIAVGISRKWQWNLRTRLAVILLAAGTLLMLGSNTPLYHLLQHISPFSIFRVPGRYVLLVSFGLALLAAEALQWIEEDRRRFRHPYAGFAQGIVFTLFIIAGLVVGGDNTAIGSELLALALILGWYWALQNARDRRVFVSFAVGATALQLAVTWYLLNPSAPLHFWTDAPEAAMEVRQQTEHFGERVACLQPGSPYWPPEEKSGDSPDDWRNRLSHNACSVWGVPSALVGDAILPLNHLTINQRLRQTLDHPGELADFCTLVGVSWLSTPGQKLGKPWEQDDEMPWLWHNPHSVGGCYMTRDVQPGPQGLPRPKKVEGAYDLHPVQCEVVAPGHLRMKMQFKDPGHLFIVQGVYPGWGCTLDGRPHRIGPALGGLSWHTEVPAGHHVVELRFEPMALQIGLMLTLLGLGVLAILGVLLRGRRKE